MALSFRSTRGQSPQVDIRTAALTGLAPDGGLYLPESWPQFSSEDIASMRDMSYQDIAFSVMRPFTADALSDQQLQRIIGKAYSVFDSPEVTPLIQVKKGLYSLELFHGPTLAFKDVALQAFGHTFETFMQDSGGRMTIVGATSGDTGSAAIAALAGRKNIEVFILYPAKGPTEIQRRQMTCVPDNNVHALEIDGSFDDCQAIVKGLFADEPFRKSQNLNTVNSINWLRIMAQIVYYFDAARKLEGVPTFVVPTGNFGDVFAGYAATMCGLPVRKLVVASNSNDILPRFFATGEMKTDSVRSTLSPSMDIQISSNFERLLYHICECDSPRVRELMGALREKGSFKVTAPELARAQKLFAAGRATDAETLSTISGVYKQYGYAIDPHTAVGFHVARDPALNLQAPVVCLATAHYAKFPEAMALAEVENIDVPPSVTALMKKPQRTTKLPASFNSVKAHILACARA